MLELPNKYVISDENLTKGRGKFCLAHYIEVSKGEVDWCRQSLVLYLGQDDQLHLGTHVRLIRISCMKMAVVEDLVHGVGGDEDHRR